MNTPDATQIASTAASMRAAIAASPRALTPDETRLVAILQLIEDLARVVSGSRPA